MNAKRVLCLLLSVMMCLSMVGTLSLSVATAATTEEALTDNMIFVNLSWTPANLPAQYTVDGRTYDLVWERNAYANAQKAVDAAPEGGTVYLCAGGYTKNFTIKKSLTLLGAKHGIDPNIRGAKESDLWALNPERGLGETVIESSINLGMDGSTVYNDYATITIDGIKMSDDAQLAATNGAGGYVDLKLKNIYVAEIDRQTGPIIFATSYHNGASNTTKRYITVDNMRIENFTTGSSVLNVTADGLDVSGVYMDENCTKPLINNCSASNGPSDEVYWNIHDNFFAAPVYRVMYLNWSAHSTNNQDMTVGAENRSKIINYVYNNVFVEATVGFRMDDMENVYFNFCGNSFYNNNTVADTPNGIIFGWVNNALDFSDQIVVKDNKFIGNFAVAYQFKNNTNNVDVSGNYSFKNGAVCPMPLAANSKATEEWYWKDEAMSVKSTEDGAGVTVTATQGLYNGKPVTASNSLPDGAVLVNPSWTEANVPATFTVRGKTFTLHWGVNAFADIPTADAAVRDFGTMYLCPGTYSTAHTTTKNLTILGPNFGINPNVKGQNERDLWTLNPNRSAEANITVSLNLSAATSVDNADFMVVDGVQLTGTGNLRSNAATIQGYAKVTIKNIYIKNNSTNPLYLFPYYPGTGAGANTFRRDVTIENVRVEKHTGSDGVLRLTAERADISGVYMHTDCTKTFLTTCSASNGPTTEAVWNLHDNQFAAPVARGIYLNWESVNAYNSVSLATGVSKRSKVITNVYSNVFVNFYNTGASSNNNRSLAARFKGQNGYFNLHGNAFYQDNAVIDTHIAFQFYSGGSMDYSDQMTCKNNRFIGEYAYDVYYNQSTVAVDISGNYAVKDGTVRGLLTSGNAGTTAQDYYYLDALMTKKSTDTSVLLAPTKVSYDMNQPGTGRADGVVTVTLPTGHMAEDIYLFWADANGKLAGYSGVAPFKVAGKVTSNRIKNGTLVPAAATRLLAYTYSAECGLSETFASVDLPANAALKESSLGALKAEFQAVGDLHIASKTVDRIHHDEHMYAMLNDIKAVSPNSIGIFANGDLADRGTDADYQKVLGILGSVEGAADFYPTFGNHETFRYDLPIPSEKTLADYQDPFFDYFGDMIPADAVFAGGERFSTLTYAFTKGGYKFISLGTDVLDQNRMKLNDTTVTWVKNQLDADRDPTRPVFVIMHQTLSDTVADDDGVLSPTDADLKNLFQNYPEVFIFNGHTHTPLNNPISAYIGDENFPSSFNCSSVGYIPEEYLGNKETARVGSEGFYVYVYENAVLVRGRDFINGEWVTSAQYLINTADGAPDVEDPVVEAPVYGMTTAELIRTADNTIGGSATCWLPADNKVDDLVLFFADKDGGILGTQPFATATVSDSFASQYVSIGFASVSIPAAADYILVYTHSDEMGYSTNCDVIRLDEISVTTGINVSSSGMISADKFIYKLGEPINVTATWQKTGDWVGMQLASITSGSHLYYHLDETISDTPLDITKQSVIEATSKYKYNPVTAGYWQIGWISADNPKQTFQTGKLAEHLITIHVIDPETPKEFGLPLLTTGDAAIGNTIYVTVEDAFAAAKNGQTVKLRDSVTTGQVIVPNGITLDLNGKTMTATYVVGFNGSKLINSAENADGKILVAKENVILSKNNPYLPVYDEAAGAYLFTRVKNDRFTVTEVGGKPQYSTSPMFKDYAHPLMDTEAKAAASGVDVIIRLTWTDSEGQYVGTQDYTYLDSSIAEVMVSYENENGEVNYSKQFYGIFVGSEIESGVDVSVTTVVKSETGVEMESAQRTLFN